MTARDVARTLDDALAPWGWMAWSARTAWRNPDPTQRPGFEAAMTDLAKRMRGHVLRRASDNSYRDRNPNGAWAMLIDGADAMDWLREDVHRTTMRRLDQDKEIARLRARNERIRRSAKAWMIKRLSSLSNAQRDELTIATKKVDNLTMEREGLRDMVDAQRDEAAKLRASVETLRAIALVDHAEIQRLRGDVMGWRSRAEDWHRVADDRTKEILRLRDVVSNREDTLERWKADSLERLEQYRRQCNDASAEVERLGHLRDALKQAATDFLAAFMTERRNARETIVEICRVHDVLDAGRTKRVEFLTRQRDIATAFVAGMIGPKYEPRSPELRELLQRFRDGQPKEEL